MAQIVTVTLNPTIDLSCQVDQVAPERKLRCTQPSYEPGGGGLNVARAIDHLGGEVLALWTQGGPTGDMLHSLLDDEGIPHHPIPISDMTRENFIVYDESSHLQYRFGMPGPELSQAEVEECLLAIRDFEAQPEYLVLSGSLPGNTDPSLYADFVRQTSNKTRVIVDTSGKALKHSLDEASLYMIKPNIRELGQLAGQPIENDAQIEEFARQLIQDGRVEVVVTSLGAGGAVVVTADFSEHVRAPTVPIRSKVGAGDSTVAGMVLALARGNSVLDAVRFGIAAGAAAVMTPGTALCRRDDTERLYAQMRAEVQPSST